MPGIFNAIDIDNLVKLHNQGVSCVKIAKIYDRDVKTIYRALRNAGCDTSQNICKNIPIDEIIQAYNDGEAEQSIAKRYNISRNVIRKRLIDNNVSIRNPSEAGRLRYSNTSFEQRKLITQKANECLRGTKYTLEQLEHRARTRGGHIGKGEIEILNLLNKISSLNAIHQFPIGKYNIDILVNNFFAVEIAVSHTHRIGATLSTKNAERVKYITNCGYTFITVRVSADAFTDDNLNRIVSDINQICINPSSKGKKWVIWCGFSDCSAFRNELGQFTSVPSSERCLYAVRIID